MKGFYFITDSKLSRAGIFNDVKDALKAKVKIIQYRQKNAGTKRMYEEASAIRKLCKNVAFLVNDRVDVALAVGADGVHLGQDDLPYKTARRLLGKKRIIGLTVHNLQEALEAQKNKADYIAVGPIFPTSTKTNAGKPVGTCLITKIKKYVTIPVVAIGGVNLENAASVVNAGADAICAISAVLPSIDVKSQIMKFQRFFKYNMKDSR